MSNLIGNRFRVLVFGQSHAPSIGAVIEGVTPGLHLEEGYIRTYCARRLARFPRRGGRRTRRKFCPG